MTDEQIYEFRKLVEPLIKFLNDNCNPHAHIIVNTVSAEIAYGECYYSVEQENDSEKASS